MVGSETEKMRFEPIDESIYVAGEQASLMDVPGTIEAVYESGERAARMVIAVYDR